MCIKFTSLNINNFISPLSDCYIYLSKFALISSMSDKRAAIIELHRAGKTNS